MAYRRSRVAARNRQSGPSKIVILIIALAVAAAIAVTLIFALGGSQPFTAQQGTMRFEYDAEGIVIRSEKLYQAENYGKTVFLAEEGQSVAAGASIAEVYSWDYSEQDVEELYTLQDTIMDYLEVYMLQDALNQDLQSLTDSIVEKTEEIAAVVRGETTGDLQKLERELKILMDERQRFLRESLNEDDQLRTYYEQENNLQTRINDSKTTITAESAWLVSFYFDGTETLLTPENMQNLTVQNIQDITAGKSFYQQDGHDVTKPLYRLVEQNLFYVVMVADEQVPEFANNTAFQVQFSGDEECTYVGKVIGYVEDSGQYLYYLEFNEDVSKLLTARRVSMKITSDYVGIEVPASAIKTVDGQQGVYYDRDGERVFEPVTVLIERDGNAIIQAVDISSSLSSSSTIYS